MRESKQVLFYVQGTDRMQTAVTPPNKGSEDVKPADQNHATGAGHHMKTAAKKCRPSKCFFENIKRQLFFLFSLGLEAKITGKKKADTF